MTSPQKRKGSQFERDAVTYLRSNGFPYAERSYGAGRRLDVGDVDGVPGWTLELKNCRAIDLAGWIDEAERERIHGRRRFGAVIAKRRNKGTSQSYVVMTLATFARLLAEES